MSAATRTKRFEKTTITPAELSLQILPRVLHENETEETEDHGAEKTATYETFFEVTVPPSAEVQCVDERFLDSHARQQSLHERNVSAGGDEGDEDATQRAARHETRGVEHSRGELALFLLVPETLGERLHLAADEDGQRGGEREVRAHGPGERIRACHLRHESQEDADEDGRPGQVLREKALDDRGHERGLRRRELRAADAVRLPNLAVRAVEEEQRPADDERRDENADDEADLLAGRRRAHEEAGLQVLRRRPRVRGRDANERAHAQGDGLVRVARAADEDEHDARGHQSGDRHAGDRVRGRTDDPDDAGG